MGASSDYICNFSLQPQSVCCVSALVSAGGKATSETLLLPHDYKHHNLSYLLSQSLTEKKKYPSLYDVGRGHFTDLSGRVNCVNCINCLTECSL